MVEPGWAAIPRMRNTVACLAIWAWVLSPKNWRPQQRARLCLGLGGTRTDRADAKVELLPQLAAGEMPLALALEESHKHNLDAHHGQPLMVRTYLDGSKTFVLDGHAADKLIVVARSSGEAGRGKG